MKKIKYGTLLLLFSFVFILAGCNEESNNYYLILMGESDNWTLSSYEVVMTPEEFKVGNGILHFKNETNYMTDWFEVIAHVVMNNEDTVVNHNMESGAETDLREKSTGGVAGPADYLNENNEPITIKDVDAIYLVVKWNNHENKKVEERIDLYQKVDKEQTWLDL